MDAANPYQPPAQDEPPQRDIPVRQVAAKYSIYVAWPVVALLNMIVPLLMAWPMTLDQGRLGMGLASSLLLAAGWLACWSHRSIAVNTVIGAVPLALSQIFPVAQLIAGLIGFEVAGAMGLDAGIYLTSESESIGSELGAFVVTLVTGSLLISAATCLGWVLVALFAPGKQPQNSEPLG